MSETLTVHHLNNSRSQRILWLLEELGLVYEVRHYRREPDMRAPEELREIHPLGKSPVVTHEKRMIAETGAIIEYILSLAPDHGMMPTEGSEHYWQARHFLHYAEGSAMPPLFLSLVLGMIPERAPFFIKSMLSTAMERVESSFVAPEINKHLDHWENAIGESGWFAGPNLSIADVMMSFPVETAGKRFGYDRHPKLREFLGRIHERDAYRRALKRGGPYDYA
ncbi:glutathione S-transferase family protein [Fulvimarina pelagi HTCC2506]|uniref:glutathione transferase n=1 Tax=Fulvimarina pelagi HTCC2506 TaxID=314231 RepID=Q0G1W8_9HYPH|nr:glutathione S-transferase [Fulvimarina pelagi]EAU41430.1 glutathione S-transferase family protein [Fulvimarina pelagi HTCC2506]